MPMQIAYRLFLVLAARARAQDLADAKSLSYANLVNAIVPYRIDDVSDVLAGRSMRPHRARICV
jgi:hypothetical protein